MLSEDRIAYYERKLTERQQEIDAQYERAAESSEPVSLDEPIGRLTRNDAMMDQQMALHTLRRLELQRTQIGTALQRLREGKFGRCVLCGEPIDEKRLDIVPESPLCMPCLRSRDDEKKRR